MQSLAGTLPRIRKAIAQQISEACMIPRGIKIPHQHIRFPIIVMLLLRYGIQTFIP